MRPLPQPDRIAPFTDRDQAALLLATKLETFRSGDVVVLTTAPGVEMGKQVAAHLGLSARPMPCREIRHPANRNQSIGSVCLKNVVLHDACLDIPQEYLQHTIARLRARIRRDMDAGGNAETYTGKTLIIVSEWLRTADSIRACLGHIREEKPARIIVATAVVSPQAILELRKLVDELIYLVEDDEVSLPQYYFGPGKDERPRTPARGPASYQGAPAHPERNYA